MDEVYKQIVNIAKKYNTKKVVLFGSRAKSQCRSNSHDSAED